MSTTQQDARIEDIERSLARHEERGNIGSWKRTGPRRWSVALHDGVGLELRTVREAHVFVCGLRSSDEAAAVARGGDAPDRRRPARAYPLRDHQQGPGLDHPLPGRQS